MISFDATKAASQAGYKSPQPEGSRVKNRPRVAHAIVYLFERDISDKIKDNAMSKEEMMNRLTQMGRTDLSDFLEEEEKEGKKIFTGEIDLDKAKLTGKMFLIKGIKKTEAGLEVTFHSVQQAMKQLADLRGFTIPKEKERAEVNTPQKPTDYDWSKLSLSEFQLLKELLHKAAIPILPKIDPAQ